MELKSINKRAYTPVYFRVNEFREKYKDWSLNTEILERTDTEISVKAEVIDNNGRVRATGHARELINDQNCKIINTVVLRIVKRLLLVEHWGI